MLGCRQQPDIEKRRSREIDYMLKSEIKKFTNKTKLLLLGTGESGKTTILKQMQILHINGFSEEEKIKRIPFIKQNIHESMYAMTTSASRINPPVEIKDEKAKQSAQYIIDLGPSEPSTWTQEYVEHVKTLWANSDIQTIFQRSNEYQLIDSAQHFLDRLNEISKEDYIPTVQDILFCRIMTVAITKIDFYVPVPKKFGGGKAEFTMFDVGGQRGHRKKWISVFDGIDAILFLIAASDFDQMLREDEKVNRLKESFHIFKDMLWSRFVRDAGMIVFLNKQDLLKKKIESGKRIEKYFPDYADYSLPNGTAGTNSEYERAKLYMKQKIIDITKMKPDDNVMYLIKGITGTEDIEDRQVYIHFTIATDTNNIKLVFDDVHNLILDINLKKIYQ